MNVLPSALPPPFPLALRYRSGRPLNLAKAAAWFVGGDSPAVWLDTLSRANLPLGELVFRIVPRSRADRRPVGVLITTKATPTQMGSPSMIPYGVRAGRLYLPLDASLTPPVTDAELDGMLPEGELVFHPAAGLSRFTDEETLGLADLLQIPREQQAYWDGAMPGKPLNRTLRSLQALQLPNYGEIFDPANQEDLRNIGNKPTREIPRLPTERGNPIRNAANGLAKTIGRCIKAFTDLLPATASRPTLADQLARFADWLIGESPGMGSTFKDREAERLLELMKKNPDLGLQYALPLDSSYANRGTSNLAYDPITNWFRRLPLFDLSWVMGAGRGGAADPWLVQLQTMERLRQSYRDAAEREISLGRYRRAAYIYAHLLNDLPAAARVLEQGKFYREAAVIYRDKLNQPLAAAECLQRGGHLLEAIDLYLGEKEYVRAGDLYRQLDDSAQAEQAYRRGIEKAVLQDDILKASTILCDKLHASSEAIALLDSAWPDSSQASRCVMQAYKLRGKLGMHGQSLAATARLQQSCPQKNQTLLTQVLVHVYETYPSDEVRAAAADSTRRLAAAALRGKQEATSADMVRMLRRLAPEDRLIRRDGNRYLNNLREEKLAIAAALAPVLSREARIVPYGRFTLDAGIVWSSVIAAGSTLYAAGWKHRELYLVRSKFRENALQVRRFPNLLDVGFIPKVLLAPHPLEKGPLYVHLVTGLDEPTPLENSFAEDDRFSAPLLIQRPAWLPERTIGMLQSREGDVWAMEVGKSPRLCRFASNGSPMASIGCGEVCNITNSTELLWPCLMNLHNRTLTMAHHLSHVCWDVDTTLTADHTERPVVGMAGSPHYSAPRTATLYPESAEVRFADNQVTRLSSELSFAQIQWTPAGHIVIANAERIEVHSTHGHEVRKLATLKGPGEPVIGITPYEADGFAVVTNKQVYLYRVANA